MNPNQTESTTEAKADFTAFVLSLSTAALQQLGEAIGQPDGAENAEPNLALAKQSIDILAMLEEKTRGNLTEQEAKFLGNVLYDLRMRFVERSQKA